MFVAGALWGVASSLVSGGGPSWVAALSMLSTFGLALAAPVCWWFAVRGQAGDRWTLGYLVAWSVWFAVLILAVIIF